MTRFESSEQLYQRLQMVFDALLIRPGCTDSYSRSNLVVRMRLTNPAAEVLLDGRQPPLEIFYGERPGRADLEVAMDADLLHAIWSGEEKLTSALFRGRVQTVGNLMRATAFVDLFHACQDMYQMDGC